jgi:phage terminase small subunit
MRPGTKSKPTALKQLAGTIETRDRRRGPEPIAPGALSDMAPPAHFTDSQKARWYQALRDAPRDVLRKIDADALAVFVLNAELIEIANAEQQKLDSRAGLRLLVRSYRDGLSLSPYVKLILKATPAMLRAAAELGFTPAARAGMTMKDDGGERTEEDARWDRLFELQKRTSRNDDSAAALAAAKPASSQPQ